MLSLLRVASICGATVAGSVFAARAFIVLSPPPWHVTEYTVFAMWSLPVGLIVVLLSWTLSRWFVRSARWRSIVIAGVASVLVGVSSGYGCYFVTGGYVGAADFPVLYCWIAGAFTGLSLAALWRPSKVSHGSLCTGDRPNIALQPPELRDGDR